jgi:hypothetical protein
LKIKFKKILVQLIRQHSSPREIALGAAIGAFISVLPLYGLHSVLVILAALIVRPANKVAILLGTNLSLPPTVPFITWTAYEIGKFLLRSDLPSLDWGFFKNLSFHKIVSFYPTLFLGSVVLGAICFIAIYALVFFIVSGLRTRNTDVHRHKNKKI